MNKFQNVSFRSVDEFLDYLPEQERSIVEVLRSIILDTIPQVHEKLSYNVPYYSRHQRICFIWPPAVEWGGHRQEGVLLGFAQGFRMNNELNFLEKGTRKQVYTHTFRSIQEVDPEVVSAYVWEAWRIDSEIAQQKRRS